jgi:chromosome segregation ATPase
LLLFYLTLIYYALCRALNRLQSRISELGVEIEEARKSLKALHKQKVSIERNLKTRNAEISEKKARVLNVQMMKFGKEIDIDVLEQQSDRSWEFEIEKKIENIEEKFAVQQTKLIREQDLLTDRLMQVRYI